MVVKPYITTKFSYKFHEGFSIRSLKLYLGCLFNIKSPIKMHNASK